MSFFVLFTKKLFGYPSVTKGILKEFVDGAFIVHIVILKQIALKMQKYLHFLEEVKDI